MKFLIVVDMQNDFVTGSLGTKEAQAIVPNIIEKIEREDYDYLYFTQDAHFSRAQLKPSLWDWTYEESLEGQKLPIGHCLYETDGYQLIPEIKNILKELYKQEEYDYEIIQKNTFGSTSLCNQITGTVTDEYEESYMTLQLERKTEIELCGVCTDICIVSNALLLRANFPNSKIIVNANCCAGSTPELHEAALKVMESCQIDIIR